MAVLEACARDASLFAGLVVAYEKRVACVVCRVLAGFTAEGLVGATFGAYEALTPGRDGASGATCCGREATRCAEGTASFADANVACTKESENCHIADYETIMTESKPCSVGGDIASKGPPWEGPASRPGVLNVQVEALNCILARLCGEEVVTVSKYIYAVKRATYYSAMPRRVSSSFGHERPSTSDMMILSSALSSAH